MIIVGIDTGQTTGVAAYDTSSGLAECRTFFQLLTDSQENANFVQWLKRQKPQVVVIEQIVGSGPRTATIQEATLISGWVAGAAFTGTKAKVLWQTPNRRKPWLPDAAKLLGLGNGYNKAKSHSVDALAHALRVAAGKHPKLADPHDWESLWRKPGSPPACQLNFKDELECGLEPTTNPVFVKDCE